jgi:hypothetical protein
MFTSFKVDYGTAGQDLNTMRSISQRNIFRIHLHSAEDENLYMTNLTIVMTPEILVP